MPDSEYDHNGECISCRAAGGPNRKDPERTSAEPCTAECGFATGQVDAAMVLRATAMRLDHFASKSGANIGAALDASADALMCGDGPRGAAEDRGARSLVAAARERLGAYLDEAAGPELDLPAESLIDQYAILVPRRQLAETLMLAADRHDGMSVEQVTRERWFGEAVRRLERYCPEAKTLLVDVVIGDRGRKVAQCLGPREVDEMFLEHGGISAADEGHFVAAEELITRALMLSLPPYLRDCRSADGRDYEFDIADTTYGKTAR